MKKYNIKGKLNRDSNTLQKTSNAYSRLLRDSRHKFSTTYRVQRIHIDNATCQCCGTCEGIIDCHHIITIKEMCDQVLLNYPDADLTDVNLRKRIAYEVQELDIYKDINNLILLCRQCHIKEHSKENVTTNENTSNT